MAQEIRPEQYTQRNSNSRLWKPSFCEKLMSKWTKIPPVVYSACLSQWMTSWILGCLFEQQSSVLRNAQFVDRRSPLFPNEATDKVSLHWYVDRIQDDICKKDFFFTMHIIWASLWRGILSSLFRNTPGRRTLLYPNEAPTSPFIPKDRIL